MTTTYDKHTCIGQLFAPYCVKRLTDGSIVVLNRMYKPLGMVSTSYVDYGEYAVRMNIPDSLARSVSCDGKGFIASCDGAGDTLYLYNDTDNPFSIHRGNGAGKRKAAMLRINKLMTALLKIEVKP